MSAGECQTTNRGDYDDVSLFFCCFCFRTVILLLFVISFTRYLFAFVGIEFVAHENFVH